MTRKIPPMINYSVEYQPIIALKGETIYGYEALARFKKGTLPLDTKTFFEEIHDDADHLQKVEKKIKAIQIKNRPLTVPTFLNIDIQSILTEKNMTYWVNFFKQLSNIVVEVVEDKTNLNHSKMKEFCKILKNNDIPFALDDYFSDSIIFSSELMQEAPIVKLDKIFIQRIRENPNYTHFLKGIIEYCKSEKKVVILEGVETQEDYNTALEIGVPYVQGFYFKNLFL